MNTDVRLLGPPMVLVEGAPAAFETRKAVAVLAYAAATGGRVSRESLIGLLWPDASTERARGSLRRTLSALRAGLGGHGVDANRSEVWLDLDHALDVDLLTFRRAVTLARDQAPDAGLPADAIAPIEDAVTLYRGDFLDGFYVRDCPEFEQWAVTEAERWRRACGQLLELLARTHGQRGRLGAAIGAAAAWLALDPLHEPAYRMLMLLNAWAGDRGGAIRCYRECTRVLDEELGVAPLDETTRLYEQILSGSVDPPMPAPVVVRPEPPPSPARPPVLPFVGRDHELGLLSDAVTTTPPGRLVLVEGEAGAGKTRLAEELAARLAGDGRPAPIVRAHAADTGVPYGPVIEALRPSIVPEAIAALPDGVRGEAARLFPQLGEVPPQLTDPGAPARFLDALAVLVATLLRGGALVVDDLQWLDEASRRLLAHLVRRLPDLPVALVLTYRPEDLPDPRTLLPTSLVDTATIRLGPLRVEDVAEITSALGRSPGDSDELHRRTGGLPLLLAEILSGGADGVSRVLGERLTALSSLGRQILSVAAVIGRPFDVDLARDVSGRSDDETLTGLEELIERGLLRELPDGRGTAFVHEVLRDAAYDATSQARRRLLHTRLGEVLAGDATRDAQAVAAAAQHLLAGGRDARAAVLFADAGALAGRQFAHADAERHYRAALAAGHTEPSAIHLALGDLATLAGDYGRAVTELERAAAHAAEDEQLGTIEHRLGEVHVRLGDWERAHHHLDAASRLLLDTTTRAALLADWAWVQQRRGRPQAATHLVKDALGLAEEAGDDVVRAHVHNLAGLIVPDPVAARAHLETSLEVARASTNPVREVAALNNLAQMRRRQGDLVAALALTEQARTLAARTGDRHREAALGNNLADLLHALGRDDEARAALTAAVVLFAQVGTEPYGLEPEVWKLVEW